MNKDAHEPVTKQTFQLSMKDINESFEVVNEKFDSIDKKFDSIDKKFDSIDKKFDSIEQRLGMCVTRDEFHVAIARLEEKMYTKEDHAKFMVWMDEAMTELRDVREERQLSGHQINRLDDTVIDHEKRINVLEKLY